MGNTDRPRTRFSSSRPRVSIVTPSYNQGQFIERTILSVLRQDYPNIEYIVLDSLSTDKTPAVLDRYRRKITKIIQAKDKGQADAINTGFQLATGEILAYLNSDDCYSSSNVVSHAVQQYIDNPDVDVLYGRRFYIDQNGFLINAHQHAPFDAERVKRSCYIPQECAFWTKDVYERVGNHINVDFHFAIDYELWFRFLEIGARFLAVDKHYGLFRWHDDSKSNAAFENVGLPEIAKLQEKYLGKAVPTREMFALFEEHFNGVNRLRHPMAAGIFDQVWTLESHLKRMVLGRAPLDHWVYANSRA